MAETKKQKNPLRLFNTLTGKVEEFKSQKLNAATIYSCGPTVYNYAHIGNLRTYINGDILRRSLLFFGYKVKQVMNITDIEDKIIRDAKKEGYNPEKKEDLKRFTEKYEKAFFSDLKELNVEKTELNPHPTDPKVIKEMIKIVEDLLQKGFAYKTDDGVYFDISKYPKYGRLSGVNLSGVKSGARVNSDEYEKEDARDFALWKSVNNGEPRWEASFGKGRPGWHIECSAMSNLFLGNEFDIHTGAVDLIFPHHENEIAQSEAYTGKIPARYWFHGEHLMIEGQKMSKSLHNIYTLSDIQKKYGVEPYSFRLLCLMSHYRERLNFTHSNIQDAQNTLNNLRDFILRIKAASKKSGSNGSLSKVIKKANSDFFAALSYDLNTPKAMAVLFEFIKKANIELAKNSIPAKESNEILELVSKIDSVLGLDLLKNESIKVPEKIIEMARNRENFRKSANYDKADVLRKRIEKEGYLIKDTVNGPLLRKKS